MSGLLAKRQTIVSVSKQAFCGGRERLQDLATRRKTFTSFFFDGAGEISELLGVFS